MANVYSVRFFATKNGTAGSTTVPDKQVAVVRDIDVWIDTGSVDGFVAVYGSAGQFFATFGSPYNVGTFLTWRGRQVLYPGEAWGWTAVRDADVTISGYLLSLP